MCNAPAASVVATVQLEANATYDNGTSAFIVSLDANGVMKVTL